MLTVELLQQKINHFFPFHVSKATWNRYIEKGEFPDSSKIGEGNYFCEKTGKRKIHAIKENAFVAWIKNIYKEFDMPANVNSSERVEVLNNKFCSATHLVKKYCEDTHAIKKQLTKEKILKMAKDGEFGKPIIGKNKINGKEREILFVPEKEATEKLLEMKKNILAKMKNLGE